MKNILIITIAILFLGSCTQEFLEPYREDPNNISGDAFFSKPSNAEAILIGAYVNIQEDNLWGRKFLQPLVLMTHESDDIFLSHQFWNEFNTNNVSPLNERVLAHYDKFYEAISSANDFIENFGDIESDTIYTEAVLEDMLGQAHALRGYAYQNLVNLFGEAYPDQNPDALGVPIITSVPKSSDEVYIPRATVAQVYDQIEQDYQEAIRLMNVETLDESNYGRLSKMAVVGLLGKMYSFKGEWQNAIDQYEIIINSGAFELVDTLGNAMDGLHEFGPESIWELNYSNATEGVADFYGEGTYNHIVQIFAARIGGWPNLFVSDYAIERFGDDPRRKEAIAMGGDTIFKLTPNPQVMNSRFDRPFTRKFVTSDRVPEYGRVPGYVANIVLMRLGDIYLMYAEALNELGRDTEALEFVNKLRKRAHYLDPEAPITQEMIDEGIVYQSLSGEALRDTIREERWRELFHEGHRWYDVQRWRILEEELAKVPESNAGQIVFNEEDYYWPIPQIEMDANPELVQSEGY